MTNLLAHEGREDVPPSSPLADQEAEYSSSSDENFPTEDIDRDSAKAESSEEDEFTVRVRVQLW